MELQQFLNTSYTSYHATTNVCKMLLDDGFEQLILGESWQIQADGKYFVTRNDSSVIAFRVGAQSVFNICESHTDSPSFKVKGDKLIPSSGLLRLNTEKYGGGLLYSYFDRPLKIAGRLLVETEQGVQQKLVCSSYNVVIPSLAIHHNPSANEGFSINAQNDTLPLLGEGSVNFYATLCEEKVLDADLFVVPNTKAFVSGVNGEFLSSARIDNLSSVYASVQALCSCQPQGISVIACLDNEEIGSGTRQGNPGFIQQVLDNVADALGMDSATRAYAMENGFVLSVDNGHALHPAHVGKYDPANKTALNGGIVIKHHVNYATDGLSSALLKRLLDKVNIPYQDYYNRSDMRCGSTLGLATARQLGVKVCDIGIAQLAMHSACETCGSADVEHMENCLTAFLSATFCQSGNDFCVQLN